MSKHNVFVVIAVIALAGISNHTSQAVAFGGDDDVDRYHYVRIAETHVFRIDSASGQYWSRTPEGTWHYEGNLLQASADEQEQRVKADPTLKLPEELVEMTVMQREEKIIPGSDKSVRIRLGDITEGQVLLSVVTADGEYLLQRTSVEQGDELRFDVGKDEFLIRVVELRNILIGDDFAKITVAEAVKKRSTERRRSVNREQ